MPARMRIILNIVFFIMIWPAISFAGVNLPKTGQTTCYDSSWNVIDCAGTGQDGEIQAGIVWPTPRFSDNGDGTITDSLTGLLWLKNANCTELISWNDALKFCNSLASGLCGLTDGSIPGDWRLPNIVELESLINAEEPSSYIWLTNQGFNNVQSGYWSSTTRAYNTNYAWHISLSQGHIPYTDKAYPWLLVWPVRYGQTGPAEIWQTGQTKSYKTGDDGDLKQGAAWPLPRFVDNNNGTIIDKLTGLIWLKDGNASDEMSWHDALDFCNNLSSGSYGLTDGSIAGDWRLPNRKELLSLVDFSEKMPPLPQGHLFENVQPSYYWSSTSLAGTSSRAWYINFSDVNQIFRENFKTFNYYVWPVRSRYSSEFLVANAGLDQTVVEWHTVTLDGSNSYGPEGDVASYLWEQTSGPSVNLSNAAAVRPTFTAPNIGSSEAMLVFMLTVTDNEGLKDTDECIINVTHFEENEIPVLWTANGNYYEAISFPSGIRWDDAKAYAENQNYEGHTGYLATITSQEENDFIFNNLGDASKLEGYLFGGFQPEGSSEPDGGWQWITGETWSFTNWQTYAPNDKYGGGAILEPLGDLEDWWLGQEDVLIIWLHSGAWNDVPRTSGWCGLIVEYGDLEYNNEPDSDSGSDDGGGDGGGGGCFIAASVYGSILNLYIVALTSLLLLLGSGLIRFARFRKRFFKK